MFEKKKKIFKKSILGFRSFREYNINQKLNVSIGFLGKFEGNLSGLIFNFIYKGFILNVFKFIIMLVYGGSREDVKSRKWFMGEGV